MHGEQLWSPFASPPSFAFCVTKMHFNETLSKSHYIIFIPFYNYSLIILKIFLAGSKQHGLIFSIAELILYPPLSVNCMHFCVFPPPTVLLSWLPVFPALIGVITWNGTYKQ